MALRRGVLHDEATSSSLLEIASRKTLAMTSSAIWTAKPIYDSGDKDFNLVRVSSSTSSASTHALKSASVKMRPRVCDLSDSDRKSTRLNSSHLVISYAV